MKKTAFTLVELIVVITILAILATIGFVSFSGYLGGTRDTNRIAQLKSMSDALELYRTKKDLPIPDDKVDVQASGTTIAYQGYIGANVLETIEYTEKGLDPKDKTYFSYYLTKDKKYFQLLTFLEEPIADTLAGYSQGVSLQNNIVGLPFMGNLNAVDYSNRYPHSKGKKLGIITGIDNTPVQDIITVTSSGYVDLVNATVDYKVIFSDISSVSGTGKTLRGIVVGGGLVGYWSFDEEVSNSFIDYSENAAVGTMSGGVSITTGKVGSAAIFDGIDGEFVVDLIENLGGNYAAPHTISAWVKPNISTPCITNSCRQWPLMLGKTYDTGSHHWLIGSSYGENQFGIYNGQQKSISLSDGIWTHVVMTFDGDVLKAYIDGQPSSQKIKSKSNGEMNLKDSSLFLGRKRNGVSEASYDGSIDELKIYNRVLTQGEVQLLYDIDK